MFKNKTLLITDGTNFFENVVLNRFINSDLKEIRIFSSDEKKKDDMRKRFNNQKVKFYIDVANDKQSVDNVMNGVDYVFHVAD